jgi:signal transduction histidine kinase
MAASRAAPAFERNVLDALPLTIYTVDLDGRITSANRSWSRFAEANGAGHLADEASVAGTSIWDALVEAASREQVERAMALLRTGRAPVVRWEFPCDSPDEARVFLMQVTPLHGSADAGNAGAAVDAVDPTADVHSVRGYVFSTVDITPSHRSREALIDTGIALSRTIDLERVFHEVAHQVLRAVPCDAFALALADEETSAMRIVHQVAYLDDGDDAAARGALEDRLTSHWLQALASRCVLLHHAERGLELTAPLTTAEGVVGAMTVLADDIESPQRLDEAQRVLETLAAQTAAAIERAWLVRRVEHKRRLEAIGEVAAGVAHELRNPLFGISSAAQLLRFRTREDPVVEKNVGRILREVERLNRMVTSLLEYGRPNTLRLAPGDPDAVWDEVLEAQRGLLESRALVLQRTRAEPPTGAQRIDPEQLAQVFTNILINAVDAAPEASDLSLTSGALPNGGWRCRLHNGGPAIPPEVLVRVFDIFYSTKQGGTGIGLALCQRIVDEHGGTITIESAPESGTALTVVLPAA